MEHGIYNQPEPHPQELAAFVGKVSAVKTRSGEDKDYFAFRTYIPKQAAAQLKLIHGDYVFFRAEKAKWYHMMEWKEMPKTWQRLPIEIKTEVVSSGMDAPVEPELMHNVASPTMPFRTVYFTTRSWAVSPAASGAMSVASMAVPGES